LISTQIQQNKALGQHYLIDHKVIARICDCIVNATKDIRGEKEVRSDSSKDGVGCTNNTSNQHDKFRTIEVGPGTGNLTRPLAECLSAQLACIEYDRRFVPVPGVQWIHADALGYQYALDDFVVGNLPYNIATHLLLRLAATPVAGWWVMVQKEVAQRVVAQTGSAYGRLSVMLQAVFDVKYCFDVPPSCFAPPPRVDSACIYGKRNNLGVDLRKLDLVVRAAFACKRKKLSNVLPPHLAQVFRARGVDLACRAETISVAEYIAIATALPETQLR
jgi:16S rRNA (adenine1518-N6/adenine1519-N6)-dimethyltransferase